MAVVPLLAAADNDESFEVATASMESADPLPMRLALTKKGIKFGPCLLYEPAATNRASNHSSVTGWLVGAWDGENWYALANGYFVNPIAWRPLPKAPDW